MIDETASTQPRADLHIHTTASDGAFTPSQVVRAAAEVGLAAIAITDHDTAAGIDEALAAGEEFGVEVVPGIEISAIHEAGVEAHILGYFINHHDPGFLQWLSVLTDARFERGRRIVERLNEVGVDLDFQRVARIAGGGAVGRPHVAKALIEIGVASSMDCAFGKYLVEGRPGYVPRYKVTPQEAIRMIIGAGGVACCAHVAKLKRDELVVQLIETGLVAVEASHPDHGPTSTKFYKRFAERRGLIATGGSDAHSITPENHGGIGLVTVPYSVVQDLKNKVGTSEV